MRIIIDIGHPAHVHLFKNLIWNVQENNHQVLVTMREKEYTTYLLDTYGIEYISFGKHHENLLKKIYYLFNFDLQMIKVAKRFKPDIFVSHGSMYAAHASAFLSKPHISLDDTEHATEQAMLCNPFTDVIITPSSYMKNLGKKQVRYDGYNELAYLHPNQFKPDSSVLDDLSVGKDEEFVILRFVSWGASHDVGHKGFSPDEKVKLVKEIEKRARPIITSEGTLPRELQKYSMKIPPHRMHDALKYALLYIGDGGTMAAEAAVLGTPSILVTTQAKYCGIFRDMHDRYGLIHTYDDSISGINKAIELLSIPCLKERWLTKMEKMLSEKIDVTEFLVGMIESYERK